MALYYVVMATPFGRYLWYPKLSCIEYYPKRARKHTYHGILDKTKNNELGALEASIKHTIATFAV